MHKLNRVKILLSVLEFVCFFKLDTQYFSPCVHISVTCDRMMKNAESFPE